MNSLPKLSLLLGLGTALAFSLPLVAAADTQVAITINGNAVDVSPEPLLQDGRVFVPLRGVFENLGATVVYDNGQINATGGSNEISLHIGSTQATVNNSPETIDVAPFIVGASTFVPLRFVSQALGANVAWDEYNHVVAITMAGVAENNSAPYDTNADYDVSDPPPALPAYEPPPVPDPNDIWQPGYWAWGAAGYYWVPGVWVAPPQAGYVWTPGYWASRNGFFAFTAGYWGVHVGFYGGINYGGGYFGNGYSGGRWEGNRFYYNTAVVRVTNTTIINTVYVDRTVVNNVTPNRVSYNGGPHGIAARPTPAQLAVVHESHLPMTNAQVQHVNYAATDRQLLSTVNHGAPPVTAAVRPFSATYKPAGPAVTPADRAAAPRAVPHPAAAYQAPAAVHAPAVTTHPAAAAYQAPAAVRPPAVTTHPAAAYQAPAPVRPPAVTTHPAAAYQAPAAVRPPAITTHPAAAYQAPAAVRPPAVTTHPAYAQPPRQPVTAHPAPVRPNYAPPAAAVHPQMHPAAAPQRQQPPKHAAPTKPPQ